MKPEDKIEIQPVQDALYVIGGKWKFPIIYSLCKGPKRFFELEKDVQGITPRMLSKELRELELNKLVTRNVFSTSPVIVEYALTGYGQTLEPVLRQLQAWGSAHRKAILEQE